MVLCSNKSEFGGIIKGIRRDSVTVGGSEVPMMFTIYKSFEFILHRNKYKYLRGRMRAGRS
jgi:hypothetical protein